jgi:hypothetical protein
MRFLAVLDSGTFRNMSIGPTDPSPVICALFSSANFTE